MTGNLVQRKDKNGKWVDWMTVEEHIKQYPGFINNIDLRKATPLQNVLPARTEPAHEPAEDHSVEISDGVKAVLYLILFIFVCIGLYINS